jgi:hypothetical protein
MNEVYPMWVAAHGIMIVIPVHWRCRGTAIRDVRYGGEESRSAAAKVDSHVLNLESAYIMSERTSLLAKTVH